jgi:hypothetical protein
MSQRKLELWGALALSLGLIGPTLAMALIRALENVDQEHLFLDFEVV